MPMPPPLRHATPPRHAPPLPVIPEADACHVPIDTRREKYARYQHADIFRVHAVTIRFFRHAAILHIDTPFSFHYWLIVLSDDADY
jgi:hypothetical protein